METETCVCSKISSPRWRVYPHLFVRAPADMHTRKHALSVLCKAVDVSGVAFSTPRADSKRSRAVIKLAVMGAHLAFTVCEADGIPTTVAGLDKYMAQLSSDKSRKSTVHMTVPYFLRMLHTASQSGAPFADAAPMQVVLCKATCKIKQRARMVDFITTCYSTHVRPNEAISPTSLHRALMTARVQPTFSDLAHACMSMYNCFTDIVIDRFEGADNGSAKATLMTACNEVMLATLPRADPATIAKNIRARAAKSKQPHTSTPQAITDPHTSYTYARVRASLSVDNQADHVVHWRAHLETLASAARMGKANAPDGYLSLPFLVLDGIDDVAIGCNVIKNESVAPLVVHSVNGVESAEDAANGAVHVFLLPMCEDTFTPIATVMCTTEGVYFVNCQESDVIACVEGDGAYFTVTGVDAHTIDAHRNVPPADLLKTLYYVFDETGGDMSGAVLSVHELK